jgi:glutamine cyclotransferase
LTNKKIDSIQVKIDKKHISSIYQLPHTAVLATDSLNCGLHIVDFHTYSEGKKTIIRKHINTYAQNIPETWTFKVEKSFPHDPEAYTQGLEFYKGILYEGNGQEGYSNVRKIDHQDGRVILNEPLESEYFGEGITFFNDQLYQITWKKEQGWIRDPASLKTVSSFSFSTDERQGWGIHHDEESLIMTDGSNTLYFINPKTLTNTKKVEVYDHQHSVEKLNELELVNGLLYANIYTNNDTIVVINPYKGNVVAYITGFNELLKTEINKGGSPDVLNGIAFHQESGHFYITGKLWSTMYEISIQK